MDLKQLKRALAAEAQAKGICSEWYNFILRATSKERLLTLFVKGLDFCLDNNFPSSELIKEFDGVRQSYGIFLDEEIAVKSLRSIVALGMSTGRVEIAKFGTAQVWVRDNAKLTVIAKENAFVCVDIADRAEVEIIASESARVSVFQHGGECVNQTSDNACIKVIDKRK